MKTCTLLISATLALTASILPAAEDAPPGALEKIIHALPDEAFAKPAKPRKLLVFSKTNGFRHASIATGKVALTEMGRKTGAFETVLSENLDSFEQETLKTFDGVCFLSPTMNIFAPRPEEWKTMTDAQKTEASTREARLKDNLMRFIKAGGGYIGIHAATDCNYDWPEYGKMVGGYFDGHPWTANCLVSVKVEPGQENHPLVAMFEGKNVEFPEEIYQLKDPYNSKSLHMLLRLDTTKTDMTLKGIKRTDGDFGIAWARHWDKGRVFYCSLGHNHEIYWHPKVVRHYLAGIQWALGDYKVEVNH